MRWHEIAAHPLQANPQSRPFRHCRPHLLPFSRCAPFSERFSEPYSREKPSVSSGSNGPGETSDWDKNGAPGGPSKHHRCDRPFDAARAICRASQILSRVGAPPHRVLRIHLAMISSLAPANDAEGPVRCPRLVAVLRRERSQSLALAATLRESGIAAVDVESTVLLSKLVAA